MVTAYMAEPEAPDLATRDKLLAVLAELIARGGAEPFLVTPVEPGSKMFPGTWASTKSGLHLVLRRPAVHGRSPPPEATSSRVAVRGRGQGAHLSPGDMPWLRARPGAFAR